MSEVALELASAPGTPGARLRLATLPGQSADALNDRTADASRLTSEAPVQLREAAAYYFHLETDIDDSIRLEPAELFDRDPNGRSGRFRPGEAVGYLELEAYVGGTRLGTAAVEVRAAKLEHEVEYRRMLRDISDFASDAILQGFQPSAESFRLDADAPTELLYRRFAVLNARLKDPTFLSAVGHVLGRPHAGWLAQTEWRDPSRPLAGGPELRRALVTGRPRRDWPTAPRGSPLTTLPRAVEIRRQEESVDTLPNRLVKFALEDWRNVANATSEAVAKSLTGAPRERGLRATSAALEQLDEWLAAPLFRSVGRLTTFPQGNQVLLKREGYRQLFASWMVSSSGADVAVDLEDPLRISQRNIATLYEYWTYLQLTAIVADVCDKPAPLESIFRTTTAGMALGLRQGKESQLTWTTEVSGRVLDVALSFNRTFAATSQPGVGSWSRAMRPDASLRIRPKSGLVGDAANRLETWLHFDAKYRVDFLVQQFSGQPDDAAAAAAAEAQETIGESKRADLLKMHAYRDAIRRTAGAYVLFPGTQEGRFALDTETLPGIGAFPLRPAPDGGSAAGGGALRSFLREVMSHVANQATRHERARFWAERIAAESSLADSPEPPMESLNFPPADTGVLLVPLRQAAELDWLLVNQICILPPRDPPSLSANDTPLTANFILLHGPGVENQIVVRRLSDWFPMDRLELEDAGASVRPTGASLCCRVGPVEEAPWWIRVVDVAMLVADKGELPLVSWLELAGTVRTADPEPEPDRDWRTYGSE